MEGRTKINLGGVDYPLTFGYLSFREIMSAANRQVIFTEDGELTDIGIPKLIHTGYENYCYDAKIPVKLTLSDFTREYDTLLKTAEGFEQVTAIIQVWSDSRDVQDLVKKTAEKKSQPETVTPDSTSPPLSESLMES